MESLQEKLRNIIHSSNAVVAVRHAPSTARDRTTRNRHGIDTRSIDARQGAIIV